MKTRYLKWNPTWGACNWSGGQRPFNFDRTAKSRGKTADEENKLVIKYIKAQHWIDQTIAVHLSC